MKYVRDVLAVKGLSVASVTSKQTVLEAAQLMNKHRIGCVVVTHGESVIGIFTERDILTRVVTDQKDPAATPVEDVMTTPCVVCAVEDELSQCQAIMTEKRIRHIPVVANGQLTGIISSGDILAADRIELESAIKYLHEYIYGP